MSPGNPTNHLPLEVQTLYAELVEQLTALEAHRSIGRVPGCFTAKTIKGETYYYFQYSLPGGKQRQVYVGKKDRHLERLVERYRDESRGFEPDVDRIRRLCAQLRAGGALVCDNASARVLAAFAEGGVFHLGGVLVGTHAFTVLGNLLGVRWRHAALRTFDVDIAGEPAMGIAVPELQADIPKTLAGLQMGFLPVPPLNPRHPSTSFKVRGSALRVDLLTPAARVGQTAPIFIPRLNAAAEPLRFLDYLIAKPERAAVIAAGGLLVNVPSPARFALHKLIIAGERAVTMQTKVEKDIDQAAQLLGVLATERPGDLLEAWDDLRQRAGGFLRRARAGFSRLKRQHLDETRNALRLLAGRSPEAR